ncbi:LytTR family DNA-binding domain-containing protein [Demequina sp. SYSU T00039]|uniref:LytTR family DNA-binding domain-containing protein n=1 Tax=Demequina lignilytica TaxID=3051663 RepID=A0AAW7M9S1_9MICO|nr:MULTISPECIES: LytTR family DNA-binding domain-containing protein [unclassified Demequina]MDN4478935.1 LytTR family DNA-binding domain-containing protein [Demequina sp. SYSU T00039-1]MDN4488810.1 LytTR family DNA-binding domain-containing protein [Demequina sp. SYSU T00039]MDN4491477.1 LytTR family DNA-binding domain-containing protein [Demequina sp. SYSU T00068]
MIRIGIVEDDAACRRDLLDHLARYAEENDVQFDLRTFPDGEDIVEGYRPQYDILFLDVEMPGMDGFEAAHAIREVDTDVVMIFVTNMGQYAIKGYEVDALSYLLKPVPYFAFAQELTRSLTRLNKRESRGVVLSVNNALVRLDPSEIVYAESVKHRITIHALDRVYTFSGTLKALEEELGDHGFFRSNNCYLVNLQHVRRVDQSTSVMTNGAALTVSRPRKKAFMDALADHMGGKR